MGTGRGAHLIVAASLLTTLVSTPTVTAPSDELNSGAKAGASARRVDPPPYRVTVVAGGDVLTESRVRVRAEQDGARTGRRFDFRPMFAPVADIIGRADLAICNQELPIGWLGGVVGPVDRSTFGGNGVISP